MCKYLCVGYVCVGLGVCVLDWECVGVCVGLGVCVLVCNMSDEKFL